MEKLNLKPTHKPVQNYYEALRQFKTIGVSHEGAVRYILDPFVGTGNFIVYIMQAIKKIALTHKYHNELLTLTPT